MITRNNSVLTLILFVTCLYTTGQQMLETKFVDRYKTSQQRFLKLCDLQTKNEYTKLCEIISDSIVVYVQDFAKGAELSFSINDYNHNLTTTKSSLSHQIYVDYFLVSKADLKQSDNVTVSIKYDFPIIEYRHFYSYNYQFTIDSSDPRILSSNSLIIRIVDDEATNEKIASLEYSKVDEKKFLALQNKYYGRNRRR